MIISHKYKVIFIHIPKTAGTSIADCLCDIDNLCMSTNYTKKHVFAKDLKNIIPITIWNNYFKFAFVRNPYDRLVSWYEHHILYGDNKNISKSFLLFLKGINLIPKERFVNQIDMISDNKNNLIIDYIGRFENLNTDFKYICDKNKIHTKKLKHLNKTNDKDYRTYYGKRELDVINNYFKKDIKYFNYKF